MKLAKRLGAITLASAMAITALPTVVMADETQVAIEAPAIEEVETEIAVVEEVAPVEEVAVEEIQAIDAYANSAEDSDLVLNAKASLTTAINQASGLLALSYTKASWDALDEALNGEADHSTYGAKDFVALTKESDNGTYKYKKADGTYYADDTAAVTAMQAAVTAVYAKIEALEKVEPLETAITNAKTKNEDDYGTVTLSDSSTPNALARAIAEAEDLLKVKRDGATAGMTEYKALDTMTAGNSCQEIADALAAVVNAPDSDVAKLDLAIEKAKTVKKEETTAYLYKALAEKLTAAQTAKTNEETDKYAAVTTALDSAITAATTASIMDAVKAFNAVYVISVSLNENDYTKTSWNNYKVASDNAKVISNFINDETKNVVADDIKKATTDLTVYIDVAKKTTKDTLVSIVSLRDVYGRSKNFVEKDINGETNYTLKSWTAYKTALDASKAMLDNALLVQQTGAPTQDEVNTQRDLLLGAAFGKKIEDGKEVDDDNKTGLVYIGELRTLKAEYDNLNASDYTTVAWNNYEQYILNSSTSQMENVALYIASAEKADEKATLNTGVEEVIALDKDKVDKLAGNVKTARKDLDSAVVTEASFADTINKAKTIVANQAYYVVLDSEADGYTNQAAADWQFLLEAIKKAEVVGTKPTDKVNIDITVGSEAAICNTGAGEDKAQPIMELLVKAMSTVKASSTVSAERGALSTLVDTVKGYIEADYVASSWSALQASLNAAKTVLNQEYPTKEALTEAKTALQKVVDSKILVSKAAFGNLIVKAKDFSKDDYTEASYTAFSTALDEAQKAYSTLSDADKALVKAAYDTFETATKALVVKVSNMTALQALVTEVTNYSENGYPTGAEWTAFKDAFDKAKEVLASTNVLQKDIDAAATKLTTAKEALKGKEINKTTLSEAIAKAKAVNADDYKIVEYVAFAKEIAKAEAVVANAKEDVSAEIKKEQPVLILAQTTLCKAENEYTKADFKTNVDAYVLALTFVGTDEEATEATSTVDSFKAVTDAKTEAMKIWDAVNTKVKDEVTTSQARKLELAVFNATKSLVKADKACVEAAVAYAKTLKEKDYTAESWKAVADAVKEAEAVVAAGGPQSKYKVSEGAVRSAISALVEAEKPSSKTFVEDLFKKVMDRDATANDVKFFQDAIATGDWTAAQLVQHFTTTPEFVNKKPSDEDFIKNIYRMGLNREADATGLGFWMGELAKVNGDRTVIMARILGSNEFADYCNTVGMKKGAVSIDPAKENFIRGLYKAAFNREATVDEVLVDWLPQLTGKTMTGSTMAKFFMQSPEFTSKEKTNREYVTALFNAFFGAVETNGLDYWTGQLAGGTQTRQSVLDFFAASEQFKAICTAAGIEL